MSNQDLDVIQIPVSGALTVAAGALKYTVPFDSEIVRVDATVGTAPTGAAAIFDVNKNGTTIFTNQANRPTIAIGASAATPVKVTRGVAVNPGPGTNQPNDTGVGYVNVVAGVVPNDTPVGAFAAGDTVSVDVDQIGSTVAGSNAVITLTLRRK